MCLSSIPLDTTWTSTTGRSGFYLCLKRSFANINARWVGSWRVNKTYIHAKGDWEYLHRAVNKQGKTVDFLLTAQRDKAAAMCFLDKPMKASSIPEKVIIGKSGANKAAMDGINASRVTPIVIRQVKYLNNIVEQDYRAIKRVTTQMLNSKSFRAVRNVLAGIELMHMIRKGQLLLQGCIKLSFANQFHALAGPIRLA